jgi:hypothetical protein
LHRPPSSPASGTAMSMPGPNGKRREPPIHRTNQSAPGNVDALRIHVRCGCRFASPKTQPFEHESNLPQFVAKPIKSLALI